MNCRHAIGFLVMGTVCGLLPELAPGWCPATGLGGSSTRALWLYVMSSVMLTIAVVTLGDGVRRGFAALLARRAVAAVRVQPAPALRPVVARARMVHPAVVRTAPAVVFPISFEPGLLEPQRAA